ncbi:hypothetical protein JYU34_008851 [Plutella xylostella]|uniref:Uncharacterized protein n=1 Tax=Plutella xylostella TaxID=51655 RepID=A0ABQ7QLZ4_PLUXY|nr:hypothetical protein JYU34_008851 [Plutella xylostella]
MSILLTELESLKLDSLDEDWVEAIHHSEFLEIVEFPAEYESAIDSVNMRSVFRNIMKAIYNWLQSDDGDEDKSWAALSQKVRHKELLTVLAFYIDYGTKNVHTKEYRNNALLASRVYYALLSIPGFKAYHIYHAQLFTHSLACLSFPREMCEKDENYYNTKELTHEVNSVIKELRPYVQDLKSVVDKLHLKPTDMNFEEILSNLVDITGGAIVNKLNIDKIELTKISRVIYVMIDTLLQEPTGEPNAVAIRLLFKCLLPKLVAASVDCRNANNLVRASYVTYSGLILTRYGPAAVSGFSVLIQHLCYAQDGLERAEVRAARVSLVVGLMSLLPRRAYRATVSWLLTLSATAKVAHRHIAMEILANLLNNEPEKVTEQPAPNPEPAQNETNPSSQNETNPTSQTEPESQDKTTADNETTTEVAPASNTEPSDNVGECSTTVAEKENDEQAKVSEPMVKGDPDPTVGLEMEPLTLNNLIDDTCPEFLAETTSGNVEITDPVASTSKNDDIPPSNAKETGDENAEPPTPVEAPPEAVTSVEVTSETTDDAMRTDDESSQDMPAVIKDVTEAEEEVAGLLRARPHTIPHLSVLRALLARCDDASGTLRARALSALAAALESRQPAVQRALQVIVTISFFGIIFSPFFSDS